jgi:dihydroneopterin aldolase
VADRIELRGLRFAAVHGLLPEEREEAQPFEVDVDLDADLAAAGRSDDLAETIDYGAVADAVAAVMNGPPAALLEHLAERVAAAALDAAGGRAASVTVAVRKLRPPLSSEVASAGVRITRSTGR